MASKPNPIVGHRYYMDMHYVLCYGPIDYISQASCDEKLLWEGHWRTGHLNVCSERHFGSTVQEGGVGGWMELLQGGPNQPQNTYLQEILGEVVPAFRGVCSVVFKRFWFGNGKVPPPIVLRGTRTDVRYDGLEQWYVEKAAIGEMVVETNVQMFSLESANPAHAGDTWEPELGVTLGNEGVSTPAKRWIGVSGFWVRWAEGSGPEERYTVDFHIRDDFGTTQYRYNGTTASEATSAFLQDHPGGVIELNESSFHQFYLIDDPIDDNVGSHIFSWSDHKISYQGDMNPAHIIHECDTNPDWGLGEPETELDDAEFRAAADKLFDERMGISLLWEAERPLDDFIEEICRHIDASHFVDIRTGLYRLYLIRDDYDINELVVLDRSNCDVLQSGSTPQDELINAVTVVYWDPKTGKDASVQVSDPAAVQRHGRIRRTTVQYPGFTNAKIATQVAMRDLRALSNSLYSFELDVQPSEAKSLHIGKPFILNMPEYQAYNLVMRVTDMDFGDGVSNKVRITCSQDVYALPEVPVMIGSDGWQNPNVPPVPSADQLAIEAPYFQLVRVYGQAQVNDILSDDPTLGYLSATASRPTTNAVDAELAVDGGGGYQLVGTIEFCPHGQLAHAIDRFQEVVNLESVEDLPQVAIGSLAQIDDELFEVTAIDAATHEIELSRGVLDTVPEDHSVGSTVLFWGDFIFLDDSVVYSEFETPDIKFLVSTGSGQLSLAQAPTETLTFAARAARPYPPANVQLNGEYWPEELPTTVELTFNTRNRLQQTAASNLLSWFDGPVSAEPNVVTDVEVYDDSSETLVDSAQDISSPYPLSELVLAKNTRLEVFARNTETGLLSNRVVCIFEIGFEIAGVLDGAALEETYSAQLTAPEAIEPVQWSISAGALPTGWSIDPASGEIGGVATGAPGSYSFTVQAEDDTGFIALSEQTVKIGTIVALLHFNGADASTSFTDETGKTWTASGNAQIDNSVTLLDGGAGLFDGGGTVGVSTSNVSDFHPNEDFTAECYLYWPEDPGRNNTILSNRTPSGSWTGWWWRITDSGILSLGVRDTVNNTAVSLTSTNPIPKNSVVHVAWCRRGDDWRMFVDGTVVDESTYGGAVSHSSSANLNVGRDPSGVSSGGRNFNGRVDELRITKGVARYWEAFTPPSAPSDYPV